MEPTLLPGINWVRAAARAHMILSHGLSDEELDALTDFHQPQPWATSPRQAA